MQYGLHKTSEGHDEFWHLSIRTSSNIIDNYATGALLWLDSREQPLVSGWPAVLPWTHLVGTDHLLTRTPRKTCSSGAVLTQSSLHVIFLSAGCHGNQMIGLVSGPNVLADLCTVNCSWWLQSTGNISLLMYISFLWLKHTFIFSHHKYLDID